MLRLRLNLSMQLDKEDDVWVALCPELDVASQGETVDEAADMLDEAVRLFLETCHEMGTLSEVLAESGVTIAVAAEMSRDGTAYALRVRGDSMIEDHICDGDLVLVEPAETVQDGEIGVAMLDDGSVTLKRIFREADRVRLQPANAEMDPIYADDVRIRGRVTSIMRRL